MRCIETDILIIGAGLSGLSTAYFLRNSDLKVTIVEARNRIGGRIHTVGYDDDQPIEMGATWVGTQHRKLRNLLSELGVETFEQVIGATAIYEPISTSPHVLAQLPENPDPTLRIKGGTEALLHALRDRANLDEVFFNTPIMEINIEKDSIVATAEKIKISAKKIISTLPPNLFVSSIKVTPSLPAELISLSRQTHTWMGESIKIALTFPTQFWQREDLSGTIFSNVGPVPEMYDHTNFEETHFALKGFLNGAFHSLTREQRLKKILSQLRKYYGSLADDLLAYHETVWCQEKFTFVDHVDHVLPHQNNGHALFQQAYLEDRLLMAGTETSTQNPGYMEGAVYRAIEASEWGSGTASGI